ncbi:MAG: M48 family metallopeptidase [Leptothrix sp. (in: b-proteobacteria)]
MRIENNVICLALLSVFAGCGTVPLTGRHQINIVSDQEVAESAKISFAKFYNDANSKNAILVASDSPSAAATLASVKSVSDKLINAAGLRGKYDWQVFIVKSKIVNAQVTPNGKIIVFTGILPVAKNEAGLAAIVGHEIAHVVAHHSAERLSQTLLAQKTLSAADAVVAAKNPQYQPAIGAALGLGAQYRVLLPFSREHEAEADHIGLIYMAKAGFDPIEAIGVWERMESSSGKGPWELLSTHPSPSTRRANMKAWQSEANLFYADRSRALPTNLADLQGDRIAQAHKIAVTPSAFAPVILPGYWYAMHATNRSSETRFHVEKNETCGMDECFSVVGSAGITATVSSQFAVMKNENVDGTWTTFSPPIRQLKFPLSVGASWSDNVVVEQSTGKKQQLVLKFDVVGYEPVSVKAGNFMAYKIISSANGVRNREAWYAPETGTFVKVVSIDSKGVESISELSDYQKTVSPAGGL